MLAEHFNGRLHGLKILGQPPGMVVSRPDLFEDILKTQFETFDKGPFFQDIMGDLLGDGIFATDGVKWMHQRKTASHLFSINTLRDAMARTMHSRIPTVHAIFQRAAAAKEPLGLIKLFHRFTIGVFAELCFGIELEHLDATQDHPFAVAVDGAQRISLLRTLRPLWYWKVLRWLDVGREHELKQHLRVINATIYDIISKCLDRRSNQDQPFVHDSQKKTLISMFMDAMSQENPDSELDPVYLRDIMVNFLIAGRDTTAQALAWCVFAVLEHPHARTKIQEELRVKLPDLVTGTIAAPSMEQVNQLVYLEAVLKEALRLYPSIPANVKMANKVTVLSDGTFVKAGTSVAIPAYVMGRLESVWGPDAKQFKPERWIDPDSGKIRPVSAFKDNAFGAGPRKCLGKAMATTEIKILLASIFSRFQLNLAPDQKITYTPSMTLAMSGQLCVHVEQAPSE